MKKTQKRHALLMSALSLLLCVSMLVGTTFAWFTDEVVTGMMKRDKEDRIPIGYIPTGTTNDFANSLHISRDIMEAADAVVHGRPFACDVGRFNKDLFVYG